MSTISHLFDSISYRYDCFNHIASFGADIRWRRIATKLLPKCEIMLDVASGTGDFCIEIAKQKKSNNIIATDISKGMISVAENKINKKKLSSQISLKLADCENLPFPNNSFDAVTCAFGVRNFEQLNKSLSEIYRVLKHNGTLVILEFSYPKNIVVRFCYNIYFTTFVPLLGRIITGNKQPFLYFTNSVKQFPKGNEFIKILNEIGFLQAKEKSLSFGVTSLYTACKK